MPSPSCAIPRRGILVSALLALLGALVIGPVGTASAHDELVSTSPTADAVLDSAPSILSMEFSADLLPVSPTIVLTGPAGEVPLETPTVDGKKVSVPVPPELAAGAYSVIWRVVSADGHPVQGAFAFTLAAPVTTAPPAATHAPTLPTSGASTATMTATASPALPSPSSSASDGSAGPAVGTIWLVVGLLALASAVGVAIGRRRR